VTYTRLTFANTFKHKLKVLAVCLCVYGYALKALLRKAYEIEWTYRQTDSQTDRKSAIQIDIEIKIRI
jgi:hypothetical protein